LNKTPQNEPQPSTSRAKQPTIAEIKAVLIERMQKVLKGELEAKKLDEHSLLTKENVKGFEKMLDQVEFIRKLNVF
jgi:lipoate-protein ligase A